MDVATLYTIYNDNAGNIKSVSLFFLGLFVMSGFMQVMIINTLIFGFLGYKTMTFLTNMKNDPELMSETLTNQSTLLKQWVVMSALVVLEYFFGSFLGTIFVILKLGAFVVLLQNSPQLLTIYDALLTTLFTKYQTQLDNVFGYLETQASTVRTREIGAERQNYNVLTMLANRFPFLERFVQARKVKKTE